MRRTFIGLLLVTSVLTLLQVKAPPVHAAGRPCFAAYHATCYGSADATIADRSMAVTPVDPTAIIARAAHLRLVQVVVERSGIPRAAGRIISYSFGVAIALDRPFPRTSRPALLVTEFVLPKVSPYTGVKSQPGTIPSVLATFPHRKLALLVAGHQPLKTLNRIALDILRS